MSADEPDDDKVTASPRVDEIDPLRILHGVWSEFIQKYDLRPQPLSGIMSQIVGHPISRETVALSNSRLREGAFPATFFRNIANHADAFFEQVEARAQTSVPADERQALLDAIASPSPRNRAHKSYERTPQASDNPRATKLLSSWYALLTEYKITNIDIHHAWSECSGENRSASAVAVTHNYLKEKGRAIGHFPTIRKDPDRFFAALEKKCGPIEQRYKDAVLADLKVVLALQRFSLPGDGAQR